MKVGRRNKILLNERDVRNLARKQVIKNIHELTAGATRDGCFQGMAMVFAILARDFGFGRKRLNQIKDSVEAEFIMMKTGFLGREYSTDDVLKMLKEDYGIDFEESSCDESWCEVKERK